MTARWKAFPAFLLALGLLASTACYGTGTAYVGVYGPAVYGPGWGGYPYPGRYPPVGGGVWIGAPVCCEEEQQDAEAPQEGEKQSPYLDVESEDEHPQAVKMGRPSPR